MKKNRVAECGSGRKFYERNLEKAEQEESLKEAFSRSNSQ